MEKLDLRQVGTIFGHKIYVNLSDMPYIKKQDEIMSNRDEEELLIIRILKTAFGMRINKDKNE